jgi:hypothetical protein
MTDRRRVLVSGASALGLLFILGHLPSRAVSGTIPERAIREAIADLLGPIVKIDDPRRLGEAYAAQYPGEARRDTLRSRLGLPNRVCGACDLRTLLERSAEEDFRAGRIVILNGWVVARTEARACALLAFS